MIALMKTWWTRLKKLPCGKWIFSRLVGFIIPYTGSVAPLIDEISPGYAKVRLCDRRRIRNHLNCFHAIALANVAELSTGLAVHFGLDNNARAILTDFEIKYLKKARGTITAIAQVEHDEPFESGPMKVMTKLFDQKNDLVAQAHATWLIGFSSKKTAQNS